jgi:protein-tyrosine phosphatase
VTRDPTALDLVFDPTIWRLSGVTAHGNVAFDVPFISHTEGNLWMGGCQDGLVLPHDITHVVSLYPWEKYALHPGATRVEFQTFDAGVGDGDFDEAALVALDRLADGPTLTHCQAGLNRSGLVAGMVLVTQGWDPKDAIALLRERRSPAVLCNRAFEAHLMEWRPS